MGRGTEGLVIRATVSIRPGLRARGWTSFQAHRARPRPWCVPTCVLGSSAGAAATAAPRAGWRDAGGRSSSPRPRRCAAYGGHGVGRAMHEDPFLFNYRVGNKTQIKSGMVIAIEPMLNLGCDDVKVLDDDWTVVTKDGKPSAHFEHTVLATDGDPILLTTLME